MDDAAVAGALFEAACARLATQEMAEVWGPMNGGAHRAHRLQVSGFEREPFLFEPRNPPYYRELFETHGFRSLGTWTTSELDAGQLEELCARIAGRPSWKRVSRGYRVDYPDPRDVEGTLARIYGLLNRVWEGHLGYVPLSPEEFAGTAAGLLSIMGERDIGVVVDPGGRDVGFAFVYPDYADEVRALAGDAAGWGRWLGGARPRRLVLHTLAFLPEARRGVAPLVLTERGLRNALERGFEELVFALASEELRWFDRVARPTREYRLYGRSLAP